MNDPVRQVILRHEPPRLSENGLEVAWGEEPKLTLPEQIRVVRPRTCWSRTYLELIWHKYKGLGGYETDAAFKFKNPEHISFLENIAFARLY